MHISCPKCGFSREVPDDKIPPKTEIANCPKCKHRFRFRTASVEVDDSMWVGTPRPVGAPRPKPQTEPAPQADQAPPREQAPLDPAPRPTPIPQPDPISDEDPLEGLGDYDDTAEPDMDIQADAPQQGGFYEPEGSGGPGEPQEPEPQSPHDTQDTFDDLDDPDDLVDPLDDPRGIKPIKIMIDEDPTDEEIFDRLEAMSGPPGDLSKPLPDEEYLLGLRRNMKQETAEEPQGVPFERTNQIGFVRGFFQTIKEVLLSPRAFFSDMDPRGGYLRPFFFYYLIAVAVVLISYGRTSLGLDGLFLLAQENMPVDLLREIAKLEIRITLVLSPILVPLSIFLGAGLTHLLLKIYGAGARGFQATVRVFCYAGAANLLAIIPLLGTLAALIWYWVIVFIGLKAVHAASNKRLVLALFVTPLLLAVAGGVLYGLFLILLHLGA